MQTGRPPPSNPHPLPLPAFLTLHRSKMSNGQDLRSEPAMGRSPSGQVACTKNSPSHFWPFLCHRPRRGLASVIFPRALLHHRPILYSRTSRAIPVPRAVALFLAHFWRLTPDAAVCHWDADDEKMRGRLSAVSASAAVAIQQNRACAACSLRGSEKSDRLICPGCVLFGSNTSS